MWDFFSVFTGMLQYCGSDDNIKCCCSSSLDTADWTLQWLIINVPVDSNLYFLYSLTLCWLQFLHVISGMSKISFSSCSLNSVSLHHWWLVFYDWNYICVITECSKEIRYRWAASLGPGLVPVSLHNSLFCTVESKTSLWRTKKRKLTDF